MRTTVCAEAGVAATDASGTSAAASAAALDVLQRTVHQLLRLFLLIDSFACDIFDSPGGSLLC